VDRRSSGMVEDVMSTKKPVRVLGTKLIDDDGIEHEWVEFRPGRWRLQEVKNGKLDKERDKETWSVQEES
jgi:hypothetical protein